MDVRQMMMQAVMGRMAQNPMVQQVLQMKQQGMDPNQVIQQLSQQYPQLRQLQGANPAQIDQMAANAMRSAGVDPNALMGEIKKMF